MNKDFLTITPDSGGRGTADVTVQASQNQGSSRTSTITISGGGMTRTIKVSQAAGVITTQYVMTVAPQTLAFKKGEIRSSFFYVTCEKQTLVNGTVTERTKIGWSFSRTGGNASSYLIFTAKQDERRLIVDYKGGGAGSGSLYQNLSFTAAEGGKTASGTVTIN